MIAVILLAVGAPSPAAGGCVTSLVQAASRHSVPPDLMLALGHAESGWKAYAINSAGVSHFPETAAEAVELVRSEQARGVRSIDVGCGQINLRWHPDVFETLADAFDPERNADYAARYLAELKARLGDWTSAVARYHSNDPEAQRVYVARVYQRLVNLQDGAPPDYFSPGAPVGAAATGAGEAAPEERSVTPRIVGVTRPPRGDAAGRVIRVPGSPLLP